MSDGHFNEIGCLKKPNFLKNDAERLAGLRSRLGKRNKKRSVGGMERNSARKDSRSSAVGLG